jgi:flagellar basal body L-ring protein FlgH
MIQREKINEGRHIIQYKVNDVVTVRVQVQSDASRGRVAKMMYKSKGPFVVKSSFHNGSYMLQRWNKPDSTLLGNITAQICTYCEPD